MLKRLGRFVAKGLDATAALWPPLETAYAWVHEAAHLLENPSHASAEQVRQDYAHLLEQIQQLPAGTDPWLQEAASRFIKVSHSYGEGLFYCYEHPDLPRTNNDLEHYFGSWRYQERRTTGRKTASASTVVRGSVRLVAAALTRHRVFDAADLRPRSLTQWRALRGQLETRHETRRQQHRFRRDPEAYLAAIEKRFLKATLPT